jgi:hypothetical protein
MIARTRVTALLERQRAGPPLIEMMAKVIALEPIGDVYLQVIRCGNNYRVTGKDFRVEKIKRGVLGKPDGRDGEDDEEDDDDDDDNDDGDDYGDNDLGSDDGGGGKDGDDNQKGEVVKNPRKRIIPGKSLCEGFFYEQEIMSLLARYNATIEGDTVQDRARKVHMYQQQRVAELLVSSVGVSDGIQSLTQELGHKKKLLAIVSRKNGGPIGSHLGIQGSAKGGGGVSLKTRTNASLFVPNTSDMERGSLTGGGLTVGGSREPKVSRVLADQRQFILKYHKLQLARQKIREARNAVLFAKPTAKK